MKRFSSSSPPKKVNTWKYLSIGLIIIVIPWMLYLTFRPTNSNIVNDLQQQALKWESSAQHFMNTSSISLNSNSAFQNFLHAAEKLNDPKVLPLEFPDTPVLGPVATDGTQPLFGYQHKGTDAIFALACNYPKRFYERFVGSLRKVGYEDDIVLAVSPIVKMKPGVEEYLRKTNTLAYPFEVDCEGKDNCKLKDEFLGYPDPRPFRTFANIRYALYEYWLRHYSPRSYVLILDFRDTFFQDLPFKNFGTFLTRQPQYNLQLFAENEKVKNIGLCKYNSLWIGRCFGKPALAELRENPVICSGSTLGSYPAIHHYIRTMLQSMDTVKCWLKGIESDQGYQNFLFYKGYFNTPYGNATLFMQGNGVVNTIGAMNGFRVPKELKGPLDTHWKARDAEGYIINYDGTRSACVHQWDRWYKDLVRFIDTKLFDSKL